ncbi:tyrosine-type recombinase/integrase [Mycobacterium kansasii]|uniref:tyrosine-type recombinase/integrase n=1 Tax=Mycobacterium sp. MS3 TaxID=3391378 RepID=UPI003989AD06
MGSRVTSDIIGSPTSFGAYGPAWVEQRPISIRTRAHYRMLLTKHILPTFASMTLEDMTPTAVATWYADTATHTPVTRIHAYALLWAIMEDALARNLIEVSPCQEVDVSTSRRAEAVCPATAEEVDAIAAAMPARYQALVLMAAWLAMPFSDLGELRRKDVDLDANLVRVRRAVALIHGRFQVTTPKSTRGIRDLPIAPVLLPRVTTHLRELVQPGREALLFPAVRDHDRHLSPSVLYPMFGYARTAAGRPDLRVLDLRRSQNLLNGAPTGRQDR